MDGCQVILRLQLSRVLIQEQGIFSLRFVEITQGPQHIGVAQARFLIMWKRGRLLAALFEGIQGMDQLAICRNAPAVGRQRVAGRMAHGGGAKGAEKTQWHLPLSHPEGWRRIFW